MLGAPAGTGRGSAGLIAGWWSRLPNNWFQQLLSRWHCSPDRHRGRVWGTIRREEIKF